MKKENRKFERINHSFEVKILRDNSDALSEDTELKSLSGVDISDEGIKSVGSVSCLKKGDLLSTSIEIDKSLSIDTECRIVWTEEGGDKMSVGMQIVSIASDDLRKLKKYLDKIVKDL